MSFDLFLVAFQDGQAYVGGVEADRQVLDSAQHTHYIEHSNYVICFPDGSHVELYAGGLHDKDKFDGGMFALRGRSFSQAVMQFIWDFAAAGRLAIFPAMEPPLVVLPSEELQAELPSDLLENRRPIVVADGHKLGTVLSDGFTVWQAYRDQIVSDAQDDSGDA